MIYELVSSKEHIYLPYVKNDQIKNNRHSLKQAIKDYISNDNSQQLIKHIEYFKNQNPTSLFHNAKKFTKYIEFAK